VRTAGRYRPMGVGAGEHVTVPGGACHALRIGHAWITHDGMNDVLTCHLQLATAACLVPSA
jgi:hypothetical protein